MADLLHALLQFPTVLFGAMLGVSLLYWLLIIVGVADLDFNPFDGAEGAVKGAVEGATKGAIEGVAESASAVKGMSGFSEALAFFGLTKVPLTISFSLFSLFGWLLSFATRNALDGVLPNVLSAIAALGVGTVGGFAITSLITKPLANLFTEGTRPGGKNLVGRTVKVTTERVDHERGQGEIDDGAGGITVTIRTPQGVTLKRGDECLVIEVDVEAGIYYVEPVNVLLPEEQLARLQAEQAQAQVQATAQQSTVPNGSTVRKPDRESS